MASVVYFVEARGIDKIKIGIVGDETKMFHRLRAIQTGCPVQVAVVGLLDGGRDLERSLHHHFFQYRSFGEWFDYRGQLRPLVAIASMGGSRLHFVNGVWQWTADPDVPPLSKRFKGETALQSWNRTPGKLPKLRVDWNAPDFYLQ